MSEERFVLFSPIGGTDPISQDLEDNYWDGSMLHICRKYKPEQIFLYLPAEMLAHQRKDNRYQDSIERLAREIGFLPHITSIERAELRDVHIFDTFYKEFPPIINKIHREFPNHTLLFNTSSGTPAMKNALYLLTAFLPFVVKPVQVSSPNKKQNYNLKKDYDPEYYWEFDQDRDPGKHVDRCSEVEYKNLNFQLRLQDIQAHLDAYDYEAALTVAKEIKVFLNPHALDLLESARNRILLNWRKGVKPELQKELGLAGSNIGEGKTDLIEYLLWLQMKQERGDLADFLRGLTPGLFYLLKIAVEEKLGYPLEKNYGKGGKLQADKLQGDDMGNEVLHILQGRGFFKSSVNPFLNSNIYVAILEKKGQGQSWINPLLLLRDVEESLRNKVAHQITRADEVWIKENLKKVGSLDSAGIMKLVREAVDKLNEDSSGKGLLRVDWGAYKNMNKKIVAALQESSQY